MTTSIGMSPLGRLRYSVSHSFPTLIANVTISTTGPLSLQVHGVYVPSDTGRQRRFDGALLFAMVTYWGDVWSGTCVFGGVLLSEVPDCG